MTRSRVRRIGNSFGIVLPKDLVREKGLKEGDEVDIEIEKARTLVEMWGVLKSRKVTLKRLHELTNEGEDLG